MQLEVFLPKPSANPLDEVSWNMLFQSWTAGVPLVSAVSLVQAGAEPQLASRTAEQPEALWSAASRPQPQPSQRPLFMHHRVPGQAPRKGPIRVGEVTHYSISSGRSHSTLQELLHPPLWDGCKEKVIINLFWHCICARFLSSTYFGH